MSLRNNSSPTYIDQLTWLRGIAAFFVIVSHSLRATEVKYSPIDEPSSFFLATLFDLGSFGVVLFFVLSGCTLYISNAEKVGYGNVHNFYVKRVFRIWPAFVVSMAFYMCFSFIFTELYAEPQGNWIEKQFLSSYSGNDILSYLTLTFNISGPAGLFNNAYWSLPVEFQYYIIFPIIVASLKYTGPFGPIAIGLALYLAPKLGLFSFDDDIIFTLAYSFCGGVLIAHIYKKSSFHIDPVLGLSSLAVLVIIISAITNSYIRLPDIPVISERWNWYVGIAVISVFLALFTKMTINPKVESFLKQYGTISYSTYLYHNLFIAIAILGIIRLEIHDGSLRLFITFFFSLIASYLAAVASYRYVEKPSIAIGRNILGRKYIKTDPANAEKEASESR